MTEPSEDELRQRRDESRRREEHQAAMTALEEARRNGASWSVLRRLEAIEEAASYAE